jgi:SAM-dependent methyltransferase
MREEGGQERNRERDQAERRYMGALFALDAAAGSASAVRSSADAASADVVRLNRAWAGTGSAPVGGVRRIVRELARLMPWNRRRVLGSLVAVANRNAEATRALIDATQHFHSHVVWYAQTVAALAAAPRKNDLGAQDVARLQRALDGVQTHWLREIETLSAREKRADARMSAINAAHEELRQAVSLAQHSTLALKRLIEERPVSRSGATSADAGRPGPGAPSDTAADDYKYVAFEDRFRGSRDEIRGRLEPYVALFDGAREVVEFGCGRGELLELLRERGIDSRGVDTNSDMVAVCRSRHLQAEEADALAYLQRQPDASLGGVVAIQVVEHFEPRYLMAWLEAAHHKLTPDAPLVMETVNPACWTAFFDGYLRDVTHRQPLHPDTLRYLAQVSGFTRIDVRYLSPVDESDRLPTVRAALPPGGAENQTLLDLIETLNAHADRLNQRLFSYRDYAIVARR